MTLGAREGVKGIIYIEWANIDLMVADGLTKALTIEKHISLVSKIGIILIDID